MAYPSSSTTFLWLVSISIIMRGATSIYPYPTPSPLYRKYPGLYLKEGNVTCKEFHHTFYVGDIWNYDDTECLEHECKDDGNVVISKCPPVPETIPDGWELKADSPDKFYPFCCLKAVPRPDPKEPGCFVEKTTVRVGDQVDIPGRCYKHVCNGNNEWSIGECDNQKLWHGWRVTPDLSKPYPECCGSAVPVLDIVPDVLDHLNISTKRLDLAFNFISVDYGNELSPSQVQDPPKLFIHHRYGYWNLLTMTDLDAANSSDPDYREVLHFVVANIRGSSESLGETFVEYLAPSPPENSGLHRYVFFLYEQPKKFDSDELNLKNINMGRRENFSSKKFAEKFNLGNPIAFNVFRSQWEEPVPKEEVVTVWAEATTESAHAEQEETAKQ